jgi:hypothetical protein
MPDIILVAKEYEVAATETDGLLEIVCWAEMSGIAVDVDVDGGTVSHIFEDGERLVGATVVAHYNFVHFHRLSEDGVELLADVMFAVVCAEGDGAHKKVIGYRL